MNILYASCRKGFDSLIHISDRNLYRDADGHDLTEAAFMDGIAGKRVLVLFHGYRSETAPPYYAKVLEGINKWGISDKYDVCVPYPWPGGKLRIGFGLSEGRADRCAKFPAAMIGLMNSHSATVDVQTHSLGARLALEALARNKDAHINQLFMLAPAVADEAPELGEKYGRVVASQTGKTAVFYSRRDKVLEFMYPIGETLTGHPDMALGFHGAEDKTKLTPNVTQFDCSKFIFDHSGYRGSEEFHDLWRSCFSIA
jgi:pimeloyl-ACP methyl ester carboxylesterase